MSRYETEEEITKIYGEPILRFTPHGDFTEKQRLYDDIPDEVMVVKIDHSTEFMVFCKYTGWVCNHGERWVIRELMRRLDTT